MKITRLFAVAGVTVFALLTGLFVLLNQTGDRSDALSFQEFLSGTPAVEAQDEGRVGLYATDPLEPDGVQHILDDVREGRINLLAELRRLRSYCGEDTPRVDCDAMVIDFLYRLPEPDGGKLVQLFDTYRKYEALREGERLAGAGVGTDLAERYARVRKVRREIFGEEDAQLVFGLEEAHADFQQLVQRFAGKQLQGQSTAARLAAFENARAEIFGPYYTTLLEREDSGNRLGLELLVRQAELEGLPESERRAAEYQLRLRYLGRERADAIRGEEERVAAAAKAENERLDAFLRAEQEFLATAADLPDAERRAGIEALRTRYLGRGGREN